MRTPARSIAVTDRYLGWLGLNFFDVAAALRWKGVDTLSVSASAEEAKLPPAQFCPPILRDALRYAVAVQTEDIDPDLNMARQPVAQLWSARLATMLEKTETVFRRSRPSLVVLVQGYEPLNAVARAASINLGIPILAVENTALKHRLLWENVSGITTNRNLAANYYWRYRNSVGEDVVNQFVDSFLLGLRNLKSEEHLAPTGSAPDDCNRPNVLFLGQVLTDSSLIFGLRSWKSPLDVIEATVDWCQRNGYRLLLKLHPKESMGSAPITNKPYNRLTYRKIENRPRLMEALVANQAVIDKDNRFDTYALIAQSKIAVTINSQAGLEATLIGKPTVICGDAFYRGLGFTVDVNHPATFDSMMDQAVHFKVPNNAYEFAYIFYERYCRPKTVGGLVDLIMEQVGRGR